MNLAEEFGGIDIYLFDQIQRGRLRPGMRLLDAGCGAGRNLAWLLRSGCDVFAADEDLAAVSAVRALAARLAPDLSVSQIHHEPVESMSFPDAFADFAISSAVLHFAQDDARFEAMLRGTWRCIAPGGVFFARLASSIGMERQVRRLEGRRFGLPDGSERYLVDAALLDDWTERLGGTWLDPLKTTIVQGQRAMTTWVLRKT